MSVVVYIAILLTVVVLAIVAVAAALVLALIQIRRAARSLEYLAGRAEDHMVKLGDAVGLFSQVALGLVGGLGRKAALGAGLVYSLVSFLRRKRRGEKQDKETEASDE